MKQNLEEQLSRFNEVRGWSKGSDGDVGRSKS